MRSRVADASAATTSRSIFQNRLDPMTTTVIYPNDRKRHRGAGIAPSQGGVDVAGRFGLALWDGAPLVEGGVSRRGGYQTIDMTIVKRLETNMIA